MLPQLENQERAFRRPSTRFPSQIDAKQTKPLLRPLNT